MSAMPARVRTDPSAESTAAGGSAPLQPSPRRSSIRRAGRRVRSKLRPVALGTLSVGVALAFWHVASSNGVDLVLNWTNVPTPGSVLAQLAVVAPTSEFATHIAVSLWRILIAYALAAALGITIGVAMGSSKTVRHVLVPHIEILRPIPAVAWIPLAILMAPSEESSIVFITFLGAFFPIVLNTIHGVEQTPEILVRAAQCMGASRMAIFSHVVIPAALPGITAGLAIGMGVAWFSLLAGEIISGQYGIGYFTWDAYSLVEYPNIIIGMIVIGGLGLLSTELVRTATRPFLRWQPKT